MNPVDETTHPRQFRRECGDDACPRGVLVLIALLGQASSQLAAQTSQPLNFFKNYLITGDYAVQGIGLRGTGNGGFASGDIVIPACAEGDTQRLGCVPKGVDIAAAFLYWQVIGDQTTPKRVHAG